MKPTYIIERWPHGWLLCSAVESLRAGIPVEALNECLPMFPKNCFMDSAIVHHVREMGRYSAVVCVVTHRHGSKWRSEITETIKNLPPQERWWKGLDVGTSSAAIFAVFCDDRWKGDARALARKSTPSDAADFGRCKRLLDTFPEWRGSLHKVSEAYPDTNWPKIMARWSEIESASPESQSEILSALNEIKKARSAPGIGISELGSHSAGKP